MGFVSKNPKIPLNSYMEAPYVNLFAQTHGGLARRPRGRGDLRGDAADLRALGQLPAGVPRVLPGLVFKKEILMPVPIRRKYRVTMLVRDYVLLALFRKFHKLTQTQLLCHLTCAHFAAAQAESSRHCNKQTMSTKSSL